MKLIYANSWVSDAGREKKRGKPHIRKVIASFRIANQLTLYGMNYLHFTWLSKEGNRKCIEMLFQVCKQNWIQKKKTKRFRHFLASMKRWTTPFRVASMISNDIKCFLTEIKMQLIYRSRWDEVNIVVMVISWFATENKRLDTLRLLFLINRIYSMV